MEEWTRSPCLCPRDRGIVMSLSLQQAIEIHGRALHYRKGARAGVTSALEQAERCKAIGDDEGFEVWRKVSAVILEREEQARAEDLPS